MGEISEINEKLRTGNAGSIVRGGGGSEIDYSAMQQQLPLSEIADS